MIKQKVENTCIASHSRVCSVKVRNFCKEPKPCNGGFDLGLLVQSSDRSLEKEFDMEKNAIAEMIGRLNVKLDQVHVGLLLYSQRVKLYNSLKNGQQRTKNVLIEKIQDLPFVSYPLSPLYDGLEKSRDELFNQNRSYIVSKVAVLFNDAQSNPVNTGLESLANSLKNDLNVDIVVVGIGNDVNSNELKKIASDPSYVIKAASYEDLFNNLDIITQTACTTNARVNLEKEEYIKISKNEVRYYKTNLKEVTSMFIQIELIETKGKVNLFYSFDEKNPLSEDAQTALSKRAVFDDASKSITNYYLIPNMGMDEIFFTLQSLDDSEVLLKIYPEDL